MISPQDASPLAARLEAAIQVELEQVAYEVTETVVAKAVVRFEKMLRRQIAGRGGIKVAQWVRLQVFPSEIRITIRDARDDLPRGD